jgi:3-methyl-2-oxobutanoate hydroxymethyltransferase
MPINCYEDSDMAYLNSRKLLDNNVDIIKFEYQDKHQSIIKKLVEENIPVCGHIGLLPQIAFKKKDLRIYGREAEERDKLIRQAKDLEELGVDIVLLECVHAEVTKEITDSINIPVIGIGSGESCNGQVQVLYDILGISNNPPKFSKNYLKDADSVSNAIKNFSNYVKKIKY